MQLNNKILNDILDTLPALPEEDNSVLVDMRFPPAVVKALKAITGYSRPTEAIREFLNMHRLDAQGNELFPPIDVSGSRSKYPSFWRPILCQAISANKKADMLKKDIAVYISKYLKEKHRIDVKAISIMAMYRLEKEKAKDAKTSKGQ